MLDYNRIAYELDGLKVVPDDVEGLSMLQHFDYPEEWHYNGNAEFSDSAKFGKGCVYFPDATSSVSVTNTTGMFNLHPEANYEFEAFVKLNDTLEAKTAELEAQGYKFFNGHTFKVFNTALTWVDAKTACEALDGHLATAPNEEKNNFLESIRNGLVVSLGARCTSETSNTWQWVTDEEWSYTNWRSGSPDFCEGSETSLMLGYRAAKQWEDVGTTTTGYTKGYICEWDYDMRLPDANILSLGGLTLAQKTAEPYSVLGLTSTNWSIDSSSTTEITPNVWHHLLPRISGQYVTLYVDGTQALSEAITGSDTLKPETVTLGGYVGYMDEFAFRRNAGSGVPTVPTTAYETEIIPVEVPSAVSNAPVSRAAWSCENLPEGLTLSSAGILGGHPTTAGTYECEFSVATNWGTATKTVHIVVA